MSRKAEVQKTLGSFGQSKAQKFAVCTAKYAKLIEQCAL